MTTLLAAPWSLATGASVWAQVIAINVMGPSLTSQAGNGAILRISTVPSSPINLRRDPITTTTTQIGLLWNAGSESGGKPLHDYRVSFD